MHVICRSIIEQSVLPGHIVDGLRPGWTGKGEGELISLVYLL